MLPQILQPNHAELITILNICLAVLSMAAVISTIILNRVKTKTARQDSDKLNHLFVKTERKFNDYFDYFMSNAHVGAASYSNTFQHVQFVNNSLERNSLFTHRISHYSDEKYKLCESVLDHIYNLNNLDDYEKIFFLIDSGSTVYNIFDLLCRSSKYDQLLNKSNQRKGSKIEIITNNIQGMRCILTYGRKDNDINAEMLIPCHVIPGKLEGKYDAILNHDSVSHLDFIMEKLRKKYPKSLSISMISGNYISLQDGVLWRGDFHGAMKCSMVINSELIYILSPLGKIFMKSFSNINDIITKSYVKYHKIGKQYHKLTTIDDDVDIKDHFNNYQLSNSNIVSLLPESLLISDDCKTKKVILATTKRIKTTDPYPKELRDYFLAINNEINRIFPNENVIINDFDPTKDSSQVIFQRNIYKDHPEIPIYKYEFPHSELRHTMINECRTSGST